MHRSHVVAYGGPGISAVTHWWWGDGTCPHCGFCPTCGRGPWRQPWVVVPYVAPKPVPRPIPWKVTYH